MRTEGRKGRARWRRGYGKRGEERGHGDRHKLGNEKGLQFKRFGKTKTESRRDTENRASGREKQTEGQRWRDVYIK